MSSSHAELNPAPPAATALPCTMCVIDAKQAAALGKDIPEPLPGALMVNGMLICDIRHALNVGPAPSSLLIAPANTLSNGGLA